jgi:hypothetical protein
MSDAYTKARAKGAKPARVSFIRGGIKYKSGCAPVRVSPAPLARPRGTMARMVQAPRLKPVAKVAAAVPVDGGAQGTDSIVVKDAPAAIQTPHADALEAPCRRMRKHSRSRRKEKRDA